MNKAINKIGFWSGILAFVSTISYVIIQALQLAGVVNFPLDEILIYTTSLCIVIPFLLEMLALHYIAPETKKIWSHAALIFSVIYSVFVTANYVVQLATVIPNKLAGSAEEIRILEQTPHSMFWDFDALGYIFMGLAMLIAVPVFEKNGYQKWVRLSFLANAFVTPMITFVYFYPVYSGKLLILGLPWAITAPLAMLMLAFLFHKKQIEPSTSNQRRSEKINRYLIGFLLGLLALNAFAGGYYGMAGAKNIPVEWLKGSPFNSYFIPGLILFVVVGGSALVGTISVYRKFRIARNAALLCGLITLLWLLSQLAIIGYVSWMQPTTAIAAILIILLTRKIPKYDC